MSFDISRITEQVNAFWGEYGIAVIIAAGVLVLALVAAGVVKAARSRQRDRWVAGMTALVVLAWTSEGLWEVARYTLGLPLAFSVMTFFVYEAMMITCALQAERHRKHHPSPGPAGRYVWVLASITATVVALNAATLVEALLRFTLPLAAAGLWWVGITAERDDDSEQVKQLRTAERARKEAIWAISWRRLLVAAGVMRPGAQTLTDAERERRIRQMVTAADRVHGSRPGSWKSRLAQRKLRRLARLATANDIATVRARVTRATRIVNLVLPWDEPRPTPDDPAGPASDVSGNGQPERVAPDLLHATATFHPDLHGAVAWNGSATTKTWPGPTQGTPGVDPHLLRNRGAAGKGQEATGVSPDGGGRPDQLLREIVGQLYRESVAAGEPLTARELAERVGCHRSTAYRGIQAAASASGQPTPNGTH